MTQVVTETASDTLLSVQYDTIMRRLQTENPPSPTERVIIEREMMKIFRSSFEEAKEEDPNNEMMEKIGDAVTALSSAAMAATSVQNGMTVMGVDTRSLVEQLIHTIITSFDTARCALGAAGLISVFVSIYNVTRALRTDANIRQSGGKIVEWNEHYTAALNDARNEVRQAVKELVEYLFTRRGQIYKPDSSSAFEVELGMQMVRCMSRIEFELRRYKELIEKAETTLNEIAKNAEEMKDDAERNMWRGKVGALGGGITLLVGIATIASGGTLVPIVTTIFGAVVTTTSGYVIYLSHQQLEDLKAIQKKISDGRELIDEHKSCLAGFDGLIMDHLKESGKYLTEAEARVKAEETRVQRDEAERRLAEAQAEIAALERRIGNTTPSLVDTAEGAVACQLREVLRRYRVEKCYDALVDLGIETAEDLNELDEDMVNNLDCKPIERKKLLKMVRELNPISETEPFLLN